MVDDGIFNSINSKISKNIKNYKIVFSENIDIFKIKEKNNSPQTKKFLKIYQESHIN